MMVVLPIALIDLKRTLLPIINSQRVVAMLASSLVHVDNNNRCTMADELVKAGILPVLTSRLLPLLGKTGPLSLAKNPKANVLLHGATIRSLLANFFDLDSGPKNLDQGDKAGILSESSRAVLPGLFQAVSLRRCPKRTRKQADEKHRRYLHETRIVSHLQ